MKKVVVIGGGMGGLTLALALKQKGISVTVHEETLVRKNDSELTLTVNHHPQQDAKNTTNTSIINQNKKNKI